MPITAGFGGPVGSSEPPSAAGMLLGQLLPRVTVRCWVNVVPSRSSSSIERLSVDAATPPAAGSPLTGESSPGCWTETISVLSTNVGPVISQRVGPCANGCTVPALRPFVGTYSIQLL